MEAATSSLETLTVQEAARRTGWSPRMLRYLERAGLVVPPRTRARYRLYGPSELEQLRGLAELRRRFGVALTDIAFALRLRREPALRRALDEWLEPPAPAWLDWEQAKHARLLRCPPRGVG